MINVKKGEIIFRQNDMGDRAYIIESGQILIYLTKEQEEIPLTLIGPGEIFGEMSLLDNQTRSASARALEETVLSAVNREQVMERVNSSDTIVQLLMRVLLKRIRNQNLKMMAHQQDTTNFDLTEWAAAPDQKAIDKIKMEIKIKEAFANKEFCLYYQPIVDLQTREVVGAEALMRWQRPKEVISPGIFIELLENSAMMVPVGEWIIEQACMDLKDFHKVHPNFVTSINVTARQLLAPNFFDYLESTTNQQGISPHHVKLEMTERIMMEGSLAIEMLKRCNKLGYQISIDDFGTGFSSLQYISQMPINDIKIDRSFVMKITQDLKTQAIVETLLFLAKSLNINVISEGIENQDEMNWLKNKGSHYGQGWLFSKALPKNELLEKLKVDLLI
jgi:EAL domain-containing protein (putative c-di-GMP-specific phosphodiesterase class I)